MIEAGLAILFILIMVYMSFDNIRLRLKVRKIATQRLQAELDKTEVLAKFSNYVDTVESTSIEKTDGFLKFVSESRDWAFNYIEDAQEKIAEFDKDLQTIIGLGGNEDTVKLVMEAYEPIRGLLPDEKGEK